MVVILGLQEVEQLGTTTAWCECAQFLIGSPQVWFLRAAAGEFSSPESSYCADFHLGTRAAPCVIAAAHNKIPVTVMRDRLTRETTVMRHPLPPQPSHNTPLTIPTSVPTSSSPPAASSAGESWCQSRPHGGRRARRWTAWRCLHSPSTLGAPSASGWLALTPACSWRKWN